MLLHFQTSASFGMLCSILGDHPRCPVSANTLISALTSMDTPSDPHRDRYR